MHWHVVTHRDNFAIGIENGAGIVATLLDVGRKCGAAQGGAHLLRYGVVKVLENLQLNGITRHYGQRVY